MLHNRHLLCTHVEKKQLSGHARKLSYLLCPFRVWVHGVAEGDAAPLLPCSLVAMSVCSSSASPQNYEVDLIIYTPLPLGVHGR